MTTTLDAGLDLRAVLPARREAIAAMLTAMAAAGPAALYPVAARFLVDDFIRTDEVDGLSDTNLACVSLAVQEYAPELTASWRSILAGIGGDV